MSAFRKHIEEKIKERASHLGESSVKTYVSMLFNLHKKINPDREDLQWFDETDLILDNLKEKSPQTRKTQL